MRPCLYPSSLLSPGHTLSLEHGRWHKGFCFLLSYFSPVHLLLPPHSILGWGRAFNSLLSSLNSLIGQTDVSPWSAGSHFISAVMAVLVSSRQVGSRWLMFGSKLCSWPSLARGQHSTNWRQPWLIGIQFVQWVSSGSTLSYLSFVSFHFLKIVFFSPIIITTKKTCNSSARLDIWILLAILETRINLTLKPSASV